MPMNERDRREPRTHHGPNGQPGRRGPGAVALALLLGGLILAGPLLAAPRWGWFGIRIRDLSELEMEEISGKLGLKEGFGVLVVDVVKGSPAETSSLRAGDLIVAIDDRPIT